MSERTPTVDPRRVSRYITVGTGILLAVGISVVSMTIGPSLGDTGLTLLGFLGREGFFVILGLIAFGICKNITANQLSKISPLIFTGSVMALLAVSLVGSSVNGSQRWISLGGLTLQPSEIYKFAVCVALPWALMRFAATYHAGIIWLASLVGLGFILLQPDLGTSIVVGLISLSIMWTWGLEKKILRGALLVGTIGGLGSIMVMDYQRKRIMDIYFSSWCDPLGACYQVNQSRIGIGSGGLFGTGPAHARSLWGFLPNAHTDFIISVIGEMFGFVGVTIVVGIFVFLVYFCGQAAMQARDLSSRLIAIGGTVWIGAEALINIAQAVGIFPVTGIPLPLVSYGGTAMVVNLGVLGLLSNIAAHQGLRRTGTLSLPRLSQLTKRK